MGQTIYQLVHDFFHPQYVWPYSVGILGIFVYIGFTWTLNGMLSGVNQPTMGTQRSTRYFFTNEHRKWVNGNFGSFNLPQ